ncbi:FAD-dependent monooxygenase [Lentzea kentuckyensis]|uniref:FAD-dependent monooxygenase n=1 Tax=Lentzea kentuckyensis TaxID=360086 RepID=UPI000A3B7C8E|nr:FAD-dependent monooxygenase [Lentzea kentuckyensis]
MTDTVIIAGAGPTGLVLAYELGLAGVDTVVLERRAEPREDAPGVAINAGVIELLGQRGLVEPLRATGISMPTAQFALLPLDANRLPEQHESTILILQSRVEQELEKSAAGVGVHVRRDHEVIAATQDTDGVTVTVRTPEGERTLRGAYLVGCDGRDSRVRALAGIAFPGVDPDFHGLIGDIEVQPTDLRPELMGVRYCDSGDHYLGAPLAPGVFRVLTAEFDKPAPDGEPGFDELAAAVHRLTGVELRGGPVRWLHRFGNPTKNAEQYQNGRILLAGDAAHVHFPLNGQGLQTGIHDAVNLGWKLAAAISGRAPAGLVETYHRERHPIGDWVCTNVRAQVELCHPPEKAAPIREVLSRLIGLDEVNRYLIELVTGLGVTYPMPGPAHPLLGRRVRDFSLSTTDGQTSVARTLHAGRGVLLDLSGADRLTAEGWQDRVDVVRAAPVDALPATALLLRPDGHVAWAATGEPDPATLHEALGHWFGAPAGTAAPQQLAEAPSA